MANANGGEGGARAQPVEHPEDSLRILSIGRVIVQLIEFTGDALISIFHKLDPASLALVARFTEKLQPVLDHDSVWMERCRQWETSVDLRVWREQMDSGKALYKLLSSLSGLVGLWSHRSDNPRGELVYVTWGVCALEGWQVIAGTNPYAEELKFEKLFDVTGKPDGSHEFRLSSDKQLSKDVIFPSQSQNEFELKINGVGKAYKRVAIGEATPGQELTGLWIAVYESHGSEIVTVSYSDNFIIGTKIIGDTNVPAEEVTFKADTKTVSTNFSFQECIGPALRKKYEGQGRISNMNFQNSSWIAGCLYVLHGGNFEFTLEFLDSTVEYYAIDLEASFRSKTLVTQDRAATSPAE